MDEELGQLFDELFLALPADSVISAEMARGLHSAVQQEDPTAAVGMLIMSVASAVIRLEAQLNAIAPPTH